jgi:acyl CoA:acetate/3-ketoacid CoA transferase beta subunit
MTYTTNEMMTVAAARRLKNGSVCFVGIGLPSKAANLARLTSSPDVVLIYESGPIGAKPSVLPLSIGDGELAETADTVVPTGEIFRYWLQGGRIDVGFSAPRRSTVSATSTPPWSATITHRKCACRVPVARRKSPVRPRAC